MNSHIGSTPGTESETGHCFEIAPTILIADDDSSIRLLLHQALALEGYQVITTSNGRDCIDAYHRYRPGMVLLDAMMPEMDGFACCRQLSRLPESHFTPILMVTSLDDRESVDEAFAAGATDFITKPIHWAVLRQRVRRLLQQADLHRQVQQFNAELEMRVEQCTVEARERTVQLRRSLELEATLKRITDKVRDSLDEGQILQTAVRELAWALDLGCCNASLYNQEKQTSSVCYEYSASIAGYQNQVINMAVCPELYQQLLAGDHLQFCSLVPNPARGQVAMFACPIMSEHGPIGDLWLVNPEERVLSDLEIRLVEQVANQCGIAIRQARLYQAAQAQVQELERLNRLKDDFLSTVSHELRSPVSNMRLAIQMLEHTLKQQSRRARSDDATDPKSSAYLKILHDECEREIGLINDLLDLQRLEAGQAPLTLDIIQLSSWIPSLAEAFTERAHQRQQTLVLDLPDDLPSLVSDPTCLRRIVVELLNNACKYTPPGETITVTATAAADRTQLQVTNTGVTIPASEIFRVFDKFYRIPSGDPWKQGGTGLGLALVKRLVAHIGGMIEVASTADGTHFTVTLPLDYAKATLE